MKSSRFTFVRMKGPTFFSNEGNYDKAKYTFSKFLKSSSPEPLGQLQPSLAQSMLGGRGFKFVQMKNHYMYILVLIK